MRALRRAVLPALLAGLAAPAAAVRPITPPAPEFPSGAAWVNSRPLTLKPLRDKKVVLVAFLNPTGLHTVRILPVLNAWFDRYALHQLLVVGVISPDLEAQKDAAWVKTQLKRLGIEFPVVLDGDRKLWKAYANDGWPALYLVDSRGRIVFDHLGEGDYEEFETEIRNALDALTGDLPDAVSPPEPRTKDCGHATPDVDMGARAKKHPLALDQDYSLHHQLLVSAREGEVSTRGRWDVEPDGLRLAQENRDQGAFVRVIWQATQAIGILAPQPGKKTRFFVKLDDQWLYEGIAGRDIKFDDDGRSYVLADDERLYDLARDTGDKAHELYVIPERRGGGLYGFAFADACTATQLP